MKFSTEKFSPKNDRYAKVRGGFSHFLYITCSKCEEPFITYQKDGKGKLLRCYTDRIVWPPKLVAAQKEVNAANVKQFGSIRCSNCNTILTNPMVYIPENRPAHRLVPDSVHMYKSIKQAITKTKE